MTPPGMGVSQVGIGTRVDCRVDEVQTMRGRLLTEEKGQYPPNAAQAYNRDPYQGRLTSFGLIGKGKRTQI